MFRLHSVWCQVFNIKQFGEFCCLKQKGFRFIPDFHSRNLLYGLEPLSQRKKPKKGYWRSDHLPFGRKTHGSLHGFQNCSTVGVVTLCCSTRKSPFCLETAAGSNMMILVFFWKYRAQDSCDDELPSLSLPLFLPPSLTETLSSPCVCIVKFAADKKLKKQIKRATGYILAFSLLFRKPPDPMAIQLYLKPGSWFLNALWHIRYPWGSTAGYDVP